MCACVRSRRGAAVGILDQQAGFGIQAQREAGELGSVTQPGKIRDCLKPFRVAPLGGAPWLQGIPGSPWEVPGLNWRK